jgi:hypothetical protein
MYLVSQMMKIVKQTEEEKAIERIVMFVSLSLEEWAAIE